MCTIPPLRSVLLSSSTLYAACLCHLVSLCTAGLHALMHYRPSLLGRYMKEGTVATAPKGVISLIAATTVTTTTPVPMSDPAAVDMSKADALDFTVGASPRLGARRSVPFP